MKKFFITLFTIVSVCVLTVIALNLKDETLNPEISPLLVWDVTPIDNNSYPFMMGFMAPIQQDPLEFGALRIKAYQEHSEDPGLSSSATTDLTGLHCESADDCYVGSADQRQPLDHLIQKNQIWLQRYRQLLQYSEFQEFLEPGPEMILIQPPILQAQRLLLAQITLDPIGLHGLLQQDIKFWRMVLGQPTGLVTKMIAIQANKSAYSVLQQLLAEHPELQESFQKELLPLTEDERSLKYCLTLEFYLLANTSLSLENLKTEESSWPLAESVSMFFYQKNATVNKLYQFHSRYSDALEQGSERRNAIYQEEVVDIMKTWKVIYNPFGKLLITIGLSNYEQFLQNVEMLDQQIKNTST